MQQLFKLDEQGKLIPYENQCIKIDNKIYTNPSYEIQYEAGYRPIGKGEIPNFNIETEIIEAESYYYNKDKTEIIPVYSVKTLSEFEIANKTIDARLTAIEQAGLERDIALMELAEMLAGGEK